MRLICFTLLGAVLCPLSSLAQLQQIQDAIGVRIETLTILGGDQGIGGGAYAFRGDTEADLSIFKIGGGGEIGPRRPLGIGTMHWSPRLEGNIGFASTDNESLDAPLTGNGVTFDTFAIELGGGARFYFTTNLSLAFTVAGIYGNTDNEFHANNPAGDAFKTAFGGTLVDWNVNTWTVVPGAAARYDWRLGRTRFELSSEFRYYYTESFGSSSSLISVSGNSQGWENKLDTDVPLGLKVFGRELHTGGFFARTEMFGDLREGLDVDHLYSVNGRLVLDFTGKLWKVRWLGVGTTYYWSKDLSGWAIGLDARFEFGSNSDQPAAED